MLERGRGRLGGNGLFRWMREEWLEGGESRG